MKEQKYIQDIVPPYIKSKPGLNALTSQCSCGFQFRKITSEITFPLIHCGPVCPQQHDDVTLRP